MVRIKMKKLLIIFLVILCFGFYNTSYAVELDSDSDDYIDLGYMPLDEAWTFAAGWTVTADCDMADYDLDSLDRLEFYDSGIYIDGGTDGYLDIDADTLVRFYGPVDFTDEDITSLDKLEFYDSGMYIDGGTDGVLALVSDGTFAIDTADWDISTAGAMTNMSFDANGTGNAITNINAADHADEDWGMLSTTTGAFTVEDFALNADADAGDVDIKSLDLLEGVDTGQYIDLGNTNQIVISCDGAGTPFSTPDIDITGTTYFDADSGFVLDASIAFGDAGVFIESDDDGYLDLDADVGIRFNGTMTTGSTYDATIATTTAGGETGIYSYPTHGTNALTGELIAVRGSARVDTIDSSSGTVMGGKFQAGNMGTGTDLSVVRGVYSEVVNKIPSGATTWSYARGFEANMDLDQGSSGNENTITNAYMFYGNYNLPTEDNYSTVTNGYGIYVSNEAVGGTGQTLDAAFLATDVNMGVAGWDYGIDFDSIGANGFGTADIRGNNGETIDNNTDGTWTFNGIIDLGDSDMTSLDKLEFYDSGMYIDGGTDGVLTIVTDGTLAIDTADWDISTTGAITGVAFDANGTGNTLTNVNVGDLVDEDFGDFTKSTTFTLDTGVVADNEIDYTAVTLADFDYQANWKVFYSDGSGDVQELAVGADGTYFQGGGASTIPEFTVPYMTDFNNENTWKVWYSDTSGDLAELALGADNTLMFSTGASGVPEMRAAVYSDITAFSEANLYTILSDVALFLEDVVDDTTPQLGGDLDLNSKNLDFPTTANISDCLDEDTMASDSATMLATQQSIKAYTDTTLFTMGATVQSITDEDATPDVSNAATGLNNIYQTANTAATTILNFDDGDDEDEFADGDFFILIVDDASTTIDFSANAEIEGNAGVDYTGSASQITYIIFLYESARWNAINLQAGYSTPTTLALSSINMTGGELILPVSDDPDVGTSGEISHDTDGWLRIYDNSLQKGLPIDENISTTIIQPDDADQADDIPIWCNFSGMSLEIHTIYAMSDADNADFTLVSCPYADFNDETTIEAITITTDSTGVYTYTIGAGDGTDIDEGTIPTGECIVFDPSADDLEFVTVTILGYYVGDVN